MFLSALLAVTLLAGCSDDNDETTFSNTAANDAAGVYEGTYYRTRQGVENAETEEAEGTMTMTAAGDYTADINFKCEEWEVNSSCIANVSHSNSGFAFSNHNNANALGSAFLGRVDCNKNVETHLTLSIITGRGVKKYSVVFKGTKVNGSDSSKQ